MKHFILICLLLTSTTLSAQLSYQIKAGANINTFQHKGNSANGNIIGPRIGFGVNYMFSKLFSLQPSAYITQKGGILHELKSTPSNTYSLDNKIRGYYLEIPVNVQLNLPIGQKSNFVLGAGPYIAYGIDGKTKIETTRNMSIGQHEQKYSEKTNTFSKKGMDINRFDGGINAILGFHFSGFIIETNMQLGLAEIYDSYNLKTLSLGLAVGYKF
ncbi:MAG: outer membrane beta-barrel protein [Bacteroidales bacterium]